MRQKQTIYESLKDLDLDLHIASSCKDWQAYQK